MQEHEFERLCRQRCSQCRKAHEMEQRQEGGHSLKFRSDTNEWQHTFSRGASMTIAFCDATKLRTQNG